MSCVVGVGLSSVVRVGAGEGIAVCKSTGSGVQPESMKLEMASRRINRVNLLFLVFIISPFGIG
jgi:hypothetical protein